MLREQDKKNIQDLANDMAKVYTSGGIELVKYFLEVRKVLEKKYEKA